MATSTASPLPAGSQPQTRKKAKINRFDNPWLNAKFIGGLCMVGSVLLMGVVGQFFWPVELSYPASSPLNLPPVWVTDISGVPGQATAAPTPAGAATVAATPAGADPTATRGGTSLTGGNPLARPTAQPGGGASLTGGNPLARPTAQATAQAAATERPRLVGAAAAARFGEPTWDHPLGTESNGRDMLAVLLVGAPRSLYIGLIAATIGMFIGIILGFHGRLHGRLGGRRDPHHLRFAIIVIPALAVLIVIGAYVKTINIESMALLLALFAWPAPTRFHPRPGAQHARAGLCEHGAHLWRQFLRHHVQRDDAQHAALPGGQLPATSPAPFSPPPALRCWGWGRRAFPRWG
jgi:ABC-type dipeptide/oligopeptide/nickel transport system permease subunit